MARRRLRPAQSVAFGSSARGKLAMRGRALRCERLEDRRLLAVVVVDTELDVVDFNDGKTSLREAVFATNILPGADEIRFQLDHDGPVTIALTQGELKIWDSLSIIGPDEGRVTIDGQQQSRLFNVEAGDVVFRQLSLVNGRTTGNNSWTPGHAEHIYSGGAIRSVTSGTLSLVQVDVHGSSTTGIEAFGGAIFVTGPLFASDCVISGNVAGGFNGNGGGIAALGQAAIVRTTVSGNRSFRGGGVSVGVSGSLLVDQSTFSGNRVVGSNIALGGAIFSSGDLTVRNSTISTNSAQATFVAQGGGLWASSSVTIAHTTIVANIASTSAMEGIGLGGGVLAYHSSAKLLTIDHSIIAGNFSTEGGAELSFGQRPLQLRYSLIADNEGTSLAEAPIGWADVNGNLIGGPEYGYIDPLLDGLKDNGGPTRTHALLAGSPAIFAGDANLTPGIGTTPEFDQRGAPFSRRVGTRIDLGAVEFSHPSFIVDSLSDESDGNYGPGELSLREAIELANEQPGLDSIEFAMSLFADGPATIFLTHGELRILEVLSIYGPGSKLLTVDATPNDRTPGKPDGFGSRVVHASADVSLMGLKLTGGDVFTGGGGGVYSTAAVSLLDVAIVGNNSNVAGGGVMAPQLTMIASVIADNRSQTGGAGIYMDRYLYFGGSLYIDRSEITGNFAWGGGAGGIYINGRGPAPNDVVVLNSVIARNRVTSGVGGMRVERASNITLSNSVVADNSGTTFGGLHVTSTGFSVLSIYGSSILGNTGGGISSGGFFTTIEDSTISGNIARTNGAGISSSWLILRRTTVTNNRAAGPASNGDVNVDGGGIAFSGELVLEDSIVAGNHGMNAHDILPLGRGSITASYSLVGDRRGTALVESGASGPDANGNLVGGPTFGVIDSLLGPLVDNGGPRMPAAGWFLTHLPLPGSPAIDGGNPDPVLDDGVTPEFDQRGAPYARVVEGRMDMGATERQSTSSYANADFNGDGVVNGNDFLVWQRGFGRTEATLSEGDALADGLVDGNDLAIWKRQFGSIVEPPLLGVVTFSVTEAVSARVEVATGPGESAFASESEMAIASPESLQRASLSAAWPFLSSDLQQTPSTLNDSAHRKQGESARRAVTVVAEQWLSSDDYWSNAEGVGSFVGRGGQIGHAAFDLAHADSEEVEFDSGWLFGFGPTADF